MRSRLALAMVITALVTGLLTALAPIAAQAADPIQVNDVTLRWGMNNESSNAAYAPGTYNFFSAGTLPDPGRGGTVINESQWQANNGNVAIEKWTGKAWKPATWAGLSTTSSGAPLTSPTAGVFSTHSYVFSKGVGAVQPDGDGEIRWAGSVTVLYYSGMSFFTIADPVLTVTDGIGTLTGTLSGYATSQTDTSLWEAIAPASVTLADLGPTTLTGAGATTLTPNYVDSWPQSYVAYLERLGSASYWHKTGSAEDDFKVPLPITISFAGTTTTPSPSAQPTRPEIPAPTLRPAPTSPAASAPVVVTTTPSATPPPTAVLALPPPATAFALAASQVSPTNNRPSWPWWTSAGLLALAVLVISPIRRRSPGQTDPPEGTNS